MQEFQSGTVTQILGQIKLREFRHVYPKAKDLKDFWLGQKLEAPQDMFIHPTDLGTMVDMLSSAIWMTENGSVSVDDLVDNVWRTSALGVGLLNFRRISEIDQKGFKTLVAKARNTSKEGILAAYKLVRYNNYYRAGVKFYQPYSGPATPDEISNADADYIRNLVSNVIDFYLSRSEVITDVKFAPEAFTHIVTKGDGDFIADGYLFDMKTSKAAFNTKQILQTLIYYFLAERDANRYGGIDFRGVGLFNPMSGKAEVIDFDDIDEDFMQELKRMLGFTE